MKHKEINIEHLDTYASKFGFSGLMYIKKDDKSFTYQHGFEDLEMKIPFNLETKFTLSMYNWSLLCIVALKLVEENKLDLEATLNTYISDYKYGDKVKIKHLIYRNSQIVDYVSGIKLNTDSYRNSDVVTKLKSDYQEEMVDINRDVFYQAINQYELLKTPGAQYAFSFSELYILKDIIEHITDMKLSLYVSTYILSPFNIVHDLGNTSSVVMYGQSNEHYHILLDVPKNLGDVITLPISSYIAFFDHLINLKFFSKETYKLTHQMVEEVGIGFYEDSDYHSYWFFNGEHNVEIIYSKKMHMTMVIAHNYFGDRVFKDGKWDHFFLHSKKYLISHFIEPHKPKLIALNKINRTAAYTIRIEDDQKRYVPNVYKCLAYSYKDNESKNYILTDQGQTIGLVTLHINKAKDDYSIRFLQIDKHYQNKGYGKILVNLACQKLKSFGATKLEIGVVASNKAAYHVYKACGFVETESFSDFIILYKSFS